MVWFGLFVFSSPEDLNFDAFVESLTSVEVLSAMMTTKVEIVSRYTTYCTQNESISMAKRLKLCTLSYIHVSQQMHCRNLRADPMVWANSTCKFCAGTALYRVLDTALELQGGTSSAVFTKCRGTRIQSRDPPQTNVYLCYLVSFVTSSPRMFGFWIDLLQITGMLGSILWKARNSFLVTRTMGSSSMPDFFSNRIGFV